MFASVTWPGVSVCMSLVRLWVQPREPPPPLLIALHSLVQGTTALPCIIARA